MSSVENRECPHCGQIVDAGEPACPACGHLNAPAVCERHPDRAAAGQCVVCGSAGCDECAPQDVPHYLCPDHREVEVIEGWAQVYTTTDDVEAQLIRGNLEAEGVDAEVLSQKDHMLTVDLGDLSQIRLLVPAYQYGQAKTVLAQHMDSVGEVLFACPACGEAYEPGDELCSSCGQVLPATSA
jgi:RNA polymerase subunit RPABC4/transcription elongation factor Spt4